MSRKKQKPVRKVCKCGWSGKTKANTCPLPLCRSPLSVQREKNGREKRVVEKVKPTPELARKRKDGQRDEMIDTLLLNGVINEAQAQAYRIFCNHRHTAGYCPTGSLVSAYGESKGGEGPPERVVASAKKAHDLGVRALDSAGQGVRAEVYGLLSNNQAFNPWRLTAGLDALADVYLKGEKT